MRRFILISHLKIHNANAMSSPFTIGFPAMTAWLGVIHALQRNLKEKGFDGLILDKVAVSCHEFNLQTYKGENDFENSIIINKTPLIFDKKYTGRYPKGNFPNMYEAPLIGDGFIEEARCHLDISLLIEYSNVDAEQTLNLLQSIEAIIPTMKFASGDIISFRNCETLSFNENKDEDQELRKISNKLMLGHVLIERRDLVIESMKQGKDALDAVLDYLKVTHSSSVDENGKVIWTSKRNAQGWLVPIAVGFQGISELGIAKNQRDADTPHRFAEAVLTLGEFIMPYRIESIDQLLWQYHVDLENNLYLCQNSTTI